jgi:hypothetical protein
MGTTPSPIDYGHVRFARPVTTLIIEFICESGVFGFAGAVASIVAMPTKPLHCAMPLPLIVGMAAPDIDDDIDMGMGVDDMNGGFPTLHITGIDMTLVGDMLNMPVAINCTCELGKVCASAAAGVTAKLSSSRALLATLFVMAVPPHPVIAKETIALRAARRKVAGLAICPPPLPADGITCGSGMSA